MTNCPTCGGTRLSPARSGAERGTCHCPREGKITSRRSVTAGVEYDYGVEFGGMQVAVEPPTLSAANAKLYELRGWS